MPGNCLSRLGRVRTAARALLFLCFSCQKSSIVFYNVCHNNVPNPTLKGPEVFRYRQLNFTVISTARFSMLIGPAHGGVFNDTGIICDKVNRLFEMIGAVSKPWGFILQLDEGGTPPAQTAHTCDNRYNNGSGGS